MKLLLKLSLALLLSVSFGKVSFAQDLVLESEDESEEYFEDGTQTRGCKRVKCLVVCGSATVGGTLSVSGNESVGGNLSVAGSITGSSFAVSPAAPAGTPGVPGIGGALAWGDVSNTTGGVAVAAGLVPMTSANTSFSGMVEGTGLPAVSGLTLTNAGVYLFQYSANYTAGAAATTTVAISLTTDAGGSNVANSVFTTESVNPAATSQVAEVSGFVIAAMPAGAFVQLRTTTGFTTSGAGTVGAKLSAIRLA